MGQNKLDVARALLRDTTIFVHFDARRPGVLVPSHISHMSRATLQFGLNMAVPIPDLAMNDDAISGTLSFSRVPIFCKVPWSSVFAITAEDKRGMIWKEDMPTEAAEEQKQLATEYANQQRRGKLKLVK